MTIPQALSVVVVAAGILIGFLALGFSSATEEKGLKWFALVAFSAGLYALSNGLHDGLSDSALVRLIGRASMSAVHLHAVAWTMYYLAAQRRRLGRGERAAIGAMLGLSILSLVPNLLVTDQTIHRSVAWLGVEYLDQVPSGLGLVGYLISIGTMVYVEVQLLRAWLNKVPGTLAKFGGLAALLAAAVNDLLASEGLIDTPYLIELAFLVVVVEVGFSLTVQFVAAAKAKESFAAKLEQTVAHRTQQLLQVHDALLQSEKLAAVGRMAAGVAHEINNPAGAVSANVEYLLTHLRTRHELPEDAEPALEECAESLRRITRIVRELLDAGRVADQPNQHEEVSILKMIHGAVVQARKSVAIKVVVDVPDDLTALSAHEALEQAVVNLLVNAGQAVAGRPEGQVVVTATRTNNRVQVRVSDNGPGIPAAARAHVFEPFFTTRGPGKGAGLGLSVSLGLIRAMGGNLRLATSTSEGTQMELDLPSHLSPYDLAASCVDPNR